MWAVISIENLDNVDEKYKYDDESATETEEDLKNECKIFRVILNDLGNLLLGAKEKSRDKYIEMQCMLAEQGILDILVKLVELIYYKCVPLQEREVAFEGKKLASQLKQYDDDETQAEIIANDYLKAIGDKLLRTIFQMIKFNPLNSQRLSKFDKIIYTQISRHETRVAKIFKEAYKRATFFPNDKSSQIAHDEGIDTT